MRAQLQLYQIHYWLPHSSLTKIIGQISFVVQIALAHRRLTNYRLNIALSAQHERGFGTGLQSFMQPFTAELHATACPVWRIIYAEYQGQEEKINKVSDQEHLKSRFIMQLETSPLQKWSQEKQ